MVCVVCVAIAVDCSPGISSGPTTSDSLCLRLIWTGFIFLSSFTPPCYYFSLFATPLALGYDLKPISSRLHPIGNSGWDGHGIVPECTTRFLLPHFRNFPCRIALLIVLSSDRFLCPIQRGPIRYIFFTRRFIFNPISRKSRIPWWFVSDVTRR